MNLNNLNLKTFTEQDALDYCLLNDINPNKIIQLNLNFNKLTDISGIKIFKNLNNLMLFNNKIKNLTFLKDLKNIKQLEIANTQIKDLSLIPENLEYLGLNNLKLNKKSFEFIINKKPSILACKQTFNLSQIKILQNNGITCLY